MKIWCFFLWNCQWNSVKKCQWNLEVEYGFPYNLRVGHFAICWQRIPSPKYSCFGSPTPFPDVLFVSPNDISLSHGLCSNSQANKTRRTINHLLCWWHVCWVITQMQMWRQRYITDFLFYQSMCFYSIIFEIKNDTLANRRFYERKNSQNVCRSNDGSSDKIMIFRYRVYTV